ncbi:hypothetical protein TSUD_03650 [Trifolium subterraneum]|nr:hypothetical protein TSUD_03650 [Trifolium subterraneum]
MEAKISIYLVFALLVLPYYSVLCEDSWQSLLDQSGVSQDTLNEAKNALGDEHIQQAAEQAIDNGSLADLVQEADDETTTGSAPTTAPANLPNDEEEDNVESPENSPTNAPGSAPKLTPANAAPKHAPLKAPSPAPSFTRYAKSPSPRA